MSRDMLRQELITWVKRRQEALPNDYTPWAHGELCVLRDLRDEIDRIFGPTNDSQSCACGWSDEEHDPREHQPAIRHVCPECYGAGGHTGLFGRWDPCRLCDPAEGRD